MSRTNPSAHQTKDLAYPCSLCHAQPGDWCKSPSGRWMPDLHAARFNARFAETWGA